MTHPGLETILRLELEAIGAKPATPITGGVTFDGTFEMIARANLSLRTASRVLLRVDSFHAAAFSELERHANRVPWERFVAAGRAAHFRVTTRKSKLYHERGIAERLATALTRRCPGVQIVAGRGDTDSEERDVAIETSIQRFVVRFDHDICAVSADTSGPLLHRRGYRVETGKAPLRETLAAGLLLAAGWDGTLPLVDPMCGSGTIPIEAALIARRIAPGLGRRFAFERWPGFDSARFQAIQSELRERIVDALPVPVIGADRDRGAIAIAQGNAERAGLGQQIVWRQGAISSLAVPSEPGWVITNPPYGARLGERDRLRDLYAQLGNVLRRKAMGWRVAMISADRRLEGQIGFRWRELAQTENGGIRVRFIAAEVG